MNITLFLILASVGASFYAWNNPTVYANWMLNPYLIQKKNQYYRFLTSGFIHADYMHLFFNMFSLYAIGSTLETYFDMAFGGTSNYYFLGLYLGGMVLADLPTFFKEKKNSSYNSLGASGAVSAVIFSFIMIAPTQTLSINFIPMPAFLFGALYLGISYYQAQRSLDNINHDAHFYGAMYGILYSALLIPGCLVNFMNDLLSWRLPF
ncbi:MAG: rhomboid family intramembrane serine protease [Cytophagales bacterium]|nr:MAG: rhomboid family intramembrane serine protease [Cytophagales bacterium]